MESHECCAVHCGTILDIGPTFVGVLWHFSRRQTICRPQLIARCIIKQSQACGKTLGFGFDYIDCPIGLLEQVFFVKVAFMVLTHLKENVSLSGFGNVRGASGEKQCTHPSSSSLNDPHSRDNNSDTISDSPLCFHLGVGFEPGTCQVFLHQSSAKNVDLSCVRRMRRNQPTFSTGTLYGVNFPIVAIVHHVLFILCPSHHKSLSVVNHICPLMPIEIHPIPFSTISPSQFCQPSLHSLK